MSNYLKPTSQVDASPFPAPSGALQREINRLFSSFDSGWPTLTNFEFDPRTDVVEAEDSIKISAELPGLEQKDVKVELVDDLLTISGEKKSEKNEKTEKQHVVERTYGRFSRSLRLPEGVKTEDIAAQIQNGVLTVTVKKPAVKKVEPRKIEVKSAT
jgi:HSP20 family protein